MLPLPNLMEPISGAMGKLKAPWNFYLQQFTQAPPNFSNLIVGVVSPFEYIAAEPGNLAIIGGTIASIVLTRGTISLVFAPPLQIVPVAINDKVDVNYTVPPTSIHFIPSYGQRTS